MKIKTNLHNQICSPKSTLHSESNVSCYTYDNLLKIRNGWNLRHPEYSIQSEDFNTIWNTLNSYMEDSCKNERCWLKKLALKNNIDFESFAPNKPKTWDKKPKEWLTNYDISRIMKQYEKTYDFFEFIGPSPLNYDHYDKENDEYVWPELKFFKIEDYIKQNISDIGIVFNLDDHDEPGSHWTTLYVDINNKRIYYFDSAAGTVPKKVKKLIDLVKNNNYKIPFKLSTNYPLEHQKRDGECGMYCMYFMISMLSKSQPWEHFSKQRIPDKEMFLLRDKIYNKK